MLFKTGEILQTRGLHSLIGDSPERHNEVVTAFNKYISGNWGNTSPADAEMNNDAVRTGNDRIVAKYRLSFADIFIITEYDRSYTTILLCDEY